MLTVHHANAVLVIAVSFAAGCPAYAARRRGASGWVAHLIALAQTLVVAQVGLGLMLLAQHNLAADRLHYAYGRFAPSRSSRRGSDRTLTNLEGGLAWFAGSTLFAAARWRK